MRNGKFVLALMLVCLVTQASNACGPFRAAVQHVRQFFSQKQQQCEPVQQPAQIGPAQAVPQQMPSQFQWSMTPVKTTATKFRTVWKQVCNGGVCTLIPVTEEVQEAPEPPEETVASAWDF